MLKSYRNANEIYSNSQIVILYLYFNLEEGGMVLVYHPPLPSGHNTFTAAEQTQYENIRSFMTHLAQ